MKIKPTKKSGKLMRKTDERTASKVVGALVKAARERSVAELKQILATTDFSVSSLEGVRYAAWMAKRFSASVLLAHVFEPPSRFSGMDEVVLYPGDRELVQQAEAQLNRLAARESNKGAEMTSCIIKGKPFHEIGRLASKRGTNLIVIATSGHTGLKRMLLGSTAERVVRHAPCPVLTVPARAPATRGAGRRPIRMKSILVPTDFSQTSVQALPYALALAEKFGAEITLLYVVEPSGLPQNREESRDALAVWDEEELVESCLTRLREVILDTCPRVRIAVRHGVPFQEINRAATTLAADLIILTTHGHTGLKHVFLGSTAERVVRLASCPVLVVRDQKGIGSGKLAYERGASDRLSAVRTLDQKKENMAKKRAIERWENEGGGILTERKP